MVSQCVCGVCVCVRGVCGMYGVCVWCVYCVCVCVCVCMVCVCMYIWWMCMVCICVLCVCVCIGSGHEYLHFIRRRVREFQSLTVNGKKVDQ